ncbi:MAG: D-3-phosphoglycerate dehydrogenase [uncultured Thermomicrobiales bacterium]|uniref:D-3-phosphoglycerate dehydrogenase n=1 Tax=uncultured Thermomicrobiales bacterium TaxID=1645740 RepID=A0A6J4V347_9BACT|nr:MAG: D-3-phosphoglycerate dehydrogenase [uncultured Thermomicrobiales bacterium]
MADRLTVLITSDRYGNETAGMETEHAIVAEYPDLAVALRGVACTTEDELIAAGAGADALLVSTREAISARVLQQLPRCKVVARYGVGLDNVDLDAATAEGIVVTHFPGYCTAEVADHALASILALNRRLVELDRDLRAGAWTAHGPQTRSILRGPVHPLREQTLGIVGFGRIGRAVALRAAPFGLTVLAADPHQAPEEIAAAGVEPVPLDALLARSDIVTIHCPLSPETRGLIDAAALARMKAGAVLVNTARGPIVDLVAIVPVLESGRLAGAALDVVDPEPLPAGSPLYRLPTVILTPHSAYYSERSVDTVRRETLVGALDVLRGVMPAVVANPSVLGRSRAPIAAVPAGDR